MNEWLLSGSIISMAVIASIAGLYPLRRQRVLASFAFVVFLTLNFLAYWHWGAYQDWTACLTRKEKEKKALALMQTYKDPNALIKQLRAKIEQNPDSAKGWYLLGRLYSAQNDWSQALSAFDKAHRLEVDNEAYTVNYAQALWQINDQKMDERIRKIFNELLKSNPKQPDALSMLAMDAFSRHDFPLAARYWTRLLEQVPPQSEEAAALRQAIAKAVSLS